MENPGRETIRGMLLVFLGIAIGSVPGAIKIDELRREVAASTADAAKQIAYLKQTSLGWQQMNKECTKIMENDAAQLYRDRMRAENGWH